MCDPAFAGLPALPGTREESAAILESFGPDEVVALSGAEAEEARVKAEVPGKRFVHLATHGVVQGEGDDFVAAIVARPTRAPVWAEASSRAG